MVREILKEERQPLRGVCAHAEIDNPIMNLGIDLNLITLRLGGDRLPRPPSAILGDFVTARPYVDGLIASAFPFLLLDLPVNLGWPSLASDKIRVELHIR